MLCRNVPSYPPSRFALGKGWPYPLAQQQARAADRYHTQLRFSGPGPGIRGYVARQDGALAEQAHVGARAMQHYELCLTNARTRQAQWARQLRQPAQRTAVIRQGEYRSPGEIQARQRQIALAKAHDQYVENVELISGEFIPLTLYDPVIRSTAEAGLLTMSGVAGGGVAAGLPSGLRWAGAGLEAGTGLRASYGALRKAPGVFAQQAGIRMLFDGTGQYVANVAFGNGWGRSLGEINFIESVMVGANINPYTTTVGVAAFSISVNHHYQSVLYADSDPRTITTAKFLAQAGTGLLLTRGGKYLEKMTENSYLSWKLYQGAMHVGTPRVAFPLLDTGVRFGQTYGVPLTNSIIGAFGFSAAGVGADWLAPNPAVPVPTPVHPDSPVFLK